MPLNSSILFSSQFINSYFILVELINGFFWVFSFTNWTWLKIFTLRLGAQLKLIRMIISSASVTFIIFTELTLYYKLQFY